MHVFDVVVASSKHGQYADEICRLIEESAELRGTGIAKRSPIYIEKKISDGQAVIALTSTEELVGFCYIESWNDREYVANSGLVVAPEFRKCGVAKRIKAKAFSLSKKRFPDAKLFGLTTSLPVMKINSELGYVPVTFNQLTADEVFWQGCRSCVNYEILQSKNRSNCLCTAMLYDPLDKRKKRWDFLKKSKPYARFMEIKKKRLTKKEPVS